jgi:hypothetical protein
VTDHRFIRHNIAGSEAGQPRPLAYLRAGWGRRLQRSRKPRRWPVLLWTAAMLSGAAAAYGAIVGAAPF